MPGGSAPPACADIPQLGLQLLRLFKANRRLERCAAGITLPEVADPAAIDALRPFGNVNALAALRTLNHRTRTRKSCNIARHFHGAPPDKLRPRPRTHRVFDLSARAARE